MKRLDGLGEKKNKNKKFGKQNEKQWRFPSEPHHSSLSIFASAPRLAVASVYAHRQASKSFSFYQPTRALQLANYMLPSSLPGDLLLEQQSNKVKKQLSDPGHSTAEVDDPSPRAAQCICAHLACCAHRTAPIGCQSTLAGLFPLPPPQTGEFSYLFIGKNHSLDKTSEAKRIKSHFVNIAYAVPKRGTKTWVVSKPQGRCIYISTKRLTHNKRNCFSHQVMFEVTKNFSEIHLSLMAFAAFQINFPL